MKKLRSIIIFYNADKHRDKADWASAAARYHKGLELAPDAFPYWVQYGHMLKELGELDAAETAYVKALNLRANDADLHIQFGHLYTRRGDIKRAEDFYAKAASLGSNDAHAKRLSHSDISPKNNEPDIVTSRKPPKLNKNQSSEELFRIADEMRDDGQAEDAAKFYQAGLQKAPSAFPYWVQLGNMLKDCNNFKEAERAYARALELRSDDSDLQLQLGHLKVKQGERALAASHYAKAVKLGSRDRFALDVIAHHEERFDIVRTALLDLLPTHEARERARTEKGPYQSFARLIVDATSSASNPSIK